MSNILFLSTCVRSNPTRLLQSASHNVYGILGYGSGNGLSSSARPQLKLIGRKKDPRQKQFEELSKTIDQVQSRRAKSVPPELIRDEGLSGNSKHKPAVTENSRAVHLQDALEYSSDNVASWQTSLNSFDEQLKKHSKLSPQLAVQSTKSFGKTLKSCLDNKKEAVENNISPVRDVKPLDKNWRGGKNKLRPHVEHQELGTSHFSKTTNVTQSIECLSPYELVILSQATSLPQQMRESFQEYLNRRLSVSSSSSSLSHPPSVVSIDVDLLNSATLSTQHHSLNTENLKIDKNILGSHSALNTTHKPQISVSDNSTLHHCAEINLDLIPSVEEIGHSLANEHLSKTEKELKPQPEVKINLEIFNKDNLKDSEKSKEMFEKIASILKPGKQITMQKALEVDQQTRDVSFVNDMTSFVELCIQTGMLKHAQSILTLGYLRSRQRQKRIMKGIRPVRNLAVYNKLMHAWAARGNIEAIRKLLIHLHDYNLKLDVQSYAIILMCLAKQDPNNISASAVAEFLDKYKKAGYRLEDILCDSRLVYEDQKSVIQAIRRIYPNFTSKLRKDDEGYRCQLLDHLNSSQMSDNPMHGILTAEELTERAWRQLKIEMQDQIIIDSILPQPQLTSDIIAARNKLSDEKKKWCKALKQGFITSKRHLVAYSAAEFGPTLLPYLELWSADVYTDFMLQEVEVLGQDMAAYSPTCSVLYQMLGNKIQNKFIVQSRLNNKYTDKVMQLYTRYAKEFDVKYLRHNHREMWTDLMYEMKLQNFMYSNSERWPSNITRDLGKFLYDIIMSEIKVTVFSKQKSSLEEPSKPAVKPHMEIPALFTVTRTRNQIPTEEVVPHPFLVRLYDDANDTQLRFNPLEMPSLVPPVPWHNHDCGGNLLNTTSIVRNPWLAQKHMAVVKSCSAQQLYPMFDGLNTISACPWRINQPMLDLIIELFNKGGNSRLDVPENISLAAELPKATADMKFEERMKILRENKQVMKERREEYSLWCTELYRLSIANKYRNDVIWFPHNMDFRGRAYPTPPHFNHMGGDLGRSLLMFANGKPLGREGLDWLKIHLINLTGIKKRNSNEERLAFANEMMDDILDSADYPFEGRKWWQSSDEPWQTLACCKELAAAVRSPNPEEFICHIPIHQDGSCNGLQHYAALGRDESGARSVNLNPFHKPQDVYSDVVDLVEGRRVADISKGIDIAKSLEGFVRRKVIKQTIMTTVYGVTQFGARSQIGGQLRHIPEFPNSDVFPGMCYLTEKTFQSLQEMFCSTKEIQDWLVLCADVISRIRQQPVEWVTPLGWPVLQPYFKTSRVSDKKLGTAMVEKPNAMKQKNAFPPNFIHSLDSAHMMLTAIHCLRAGIMFASVHDCFWTHACDVATMNKICREQFVALHKNQILEELADYLGDKFGYTSDSITQENKAEKQSAKNLVNYILRRVPSRGTFDIQKVLESTYFFS